MPGIALGAVPAPASPVHLCLIRTDPGFGLPRQWCLFVGRADESGMTYEVIDETPSIAGDELREVTDHCITSLPGTASTRSMFIMATLTITQAGMVGDIAIMEPPSRIFNPLLVADSQGWAIRVIAKLVEQGIVLQARLDDVLCMLETFDPYSRASFLAS
ncbi:hypothetical protein BJX99DRAFT_233121 [Aspergillus californicus]